MKTLPTQFDSGRLSPAVATPSCCSSCCCCCCLATTLTSSAILAQYTSHKIKERQLSGKKWAVALAAAVLPITALIYIAYMSSAYELIDLINRQSAATADVIAPAIAFAPLILPLLGFWFIFKKINSQHPFLFAILVLVLISFVLPGEVIAAILLLALFDEAAMLVYLVLSAVVTVTVVSIYGSYLKKRLRNKPGDLLVGPAGSGASYDTGNKINPDLTSNGLSPNNNTQKPVSNNQGSSNVVYPPPQSESDSDDKNVR